MPIPLLSVSHTLIEGRLGFDLMAAGAALVIAAFRIAWLDERCAKAAKQSE